MPQVNLDKAKEILNKRYGFYSADSVVIWWLMVVALSLLTGSFAKEAGAASLSEVSHFGSNLRNLRMFH